MSVPMAVLVAQNDRRTQLSNWNIPGFDNYDGCCKNVGQQGKRQICHLRDIDEESAQVLIARMTTGNIQTTLFWSEHRAQARRTMPLPVTIYYIRTPETARVKG